MIQKLLSKTNRFLAELCGWLLVAIVLALLLEVFCRQLGIGVYGISEIAVFITVAVIYLGLANCEEHQEHVRVDFLTIRFSPQKRHFVYFLNYIIGSTMVGISFFSMLDNAVLSFQDKESISGVVPLWLYPVKFIVAFGLLIFTLEMIRSTMMEIKQMKHAGNKKAGE